MRVAATFREPGTGPWGWPLGWAFGLGVRLRLAAYDAGLMKSEHSGLFTVSIGGLEAGGSGKTPVTAHVLRRLITRGARPGLLSRGYGRASRDLVVRAPGEPADARTLGDEPAMLIASGLDVPVAVCARRIEGARAIRRLAPTCLVLDDAFSHRALRRDVDIVVLRGEQPFGNGRMLPAGTLREPPSSVARAHVVWRHFRGRTLADELPPVPDAVTRLAPAASLVTSVDGPLSVHRDGAPVGHQGRRVVAACGIARPRPFLESLGAAGLDVAAARVFADHHPYERADADALEHLVAHERAEALLVTAKDAVKLSPFFHGATPLWVATRELLIVDGEPALDQRLSPPDRGL